MHVYTTETAQYTSEVRFYEGKEHLVVPVIMMVEGVHSGSHGPLLHLASELGRFPGSWDGIPITVQHPEQDGMNVSANSPDVLSRYAVGRVFNTHMDGIKLKADAWIDITRCAAISPTALQYIRSNRALEVSIGVFTDEEAAEGVHNNEEYVAIARNHRPDHLALLPGEQGACSWTDGCGVRANKSNLNVNANEDMKEEQIQALKDLIRTGHSVAIHVNQQGYAELVRKAQQKLDAMDNDQAVYFLEELYDDRLVYRVMAREERSHQYFQQSYSIDNAGDVSFNGERSRVRKDVNYVQMNKKMERKDKKMEVNEDKPCCKEKVDALIANKATRFTEDDRQWLLTMEEDTIKKLEPIIEVNEEKPKAKPQINMDDYIKKDTLKTIEDYMAIVPVEFKEQFEAGLKLHNDHRAEMVKTILDNSEKETWTEDELKEMNTNMLEKISKSIKPTADYSGMATGGKEDVQANKGEEVLLPPGVEIES